MNVVLSMDRARHNNADSLELGFRVVDELSTDMRDIPNPRQRERRRRGSASTKEYAEGRPEDPSRMDILERSITALARSVEHMHIGREPPHTDRNFRPETPRYPTTPFSRQDREAFVHDYMGLERMDMPQLEGKHTTNEVLTEKKIPKPFMFIEKFGLDTLTKKMNHRANITAQEYVNAFVRMLWDPRARDAAALPFELAHLKDVTTDIVTRHWSSVRSWAQCVFDSIDNGAYDWPAFSRSRTIGFACRSAAHHSMRPHLKAPPAHARHCAWIIIISAVRMVGNICTTSRMV